MRTESALSILFLSTEYPPETGWGGIGTYTYHMAQALAERGHEVHVLSVAPSEPERHYKDGEVRVHRMVQRDLWRLRRVRSAPMPIPHLEKAVSNYLACRRLGIKFDVIEYPEWSAEGLLFPSLQSKPTVAHLHTALPLVAQYEGIKESTLSRLAASLEGLSVRQADAITSPSQAMADWTIKRFRLGNHVVAIIPHPAPIPDPTHGAVAVKAFDQGKVLFVGRLNSKKNPEVIVRAAQLVREKIPRAEFTFVGGGADLREGIAYQEWLTRLAQAHGVASHVHFTGPLSRQDVGVLYRAASVVVVPSRWENFPYVVLEAMTAARPIVASRAGGIPEIIRDRETGWLVDPEDTEGWAEALVALLGDPQQARQMGRQALEDVLARFHPAKIAAQREAVYRHAMAVHQNQQHG